MATTTTRFTKLRTWVQLGFLALWLNPLVYLPHVCGLAFHCHACPLASFACPIGALAGCAAWHIVPFAIIGLLLAVAMSLGSLICGWACPFGLLQDLAAKLPTRKRPLPAWTGYGRYVVLAVFVVAVPYWLGEDSRLFICRLCPAGTLEAALPYTVESGTWPSVPRLVVLVPFQAARVLIRRPWCHVLCPRGGLLAWNPKDSALYFCCGCAWTRRGARAAGGARRRAPSGSTRPRSSTPRAASAASSAPTPPAARSPPP